MPVATRSTRDLADEATPAPAATRGPDRDTRDIGGGALSPVPARKLFSPAVAGGTAIALPAVTQLKTSTGIHQLHQINGADLADFIDAHIDASQVKIAIRTYTYQISCILE